MEVLFYLKAVKEMEYEFKESEKVFRNIKHKGSIQKLRKIKFFLNIQKTYLYFHTKFLLLQFNTCLNLEVFLHYNI